MSSMLSAEQMTQTQKRLDGFKAGHGTILFFDDESVVRQQQEAFKLYAENFPIWANQSNVSVEWEVSCFSLLTDHHLRPRVWLN